jgi:hypothetical protein
MSGSGSTAAIGGNGPNANTDLIGTSHSVHASNPDLSSVTVNGGALSSMTPVSSTTFLRRKNSQHQLVVPGGIVGRASSSHLLRYPPVMLGGIGCCSGAALSGLIDVDDPQFILGQDADNTADRDAHYHTIQTTTGNYHRAPLPRWHDRVLNDY